MNKIKLPRYFSAKAQMPENALFWQTMLDQSDNFAFNTVDQGKGGPFGSQIWLVNKKSGEHILCGTPEEPEDSNAVVEKASASAHAEAESLLPEKRKAIINFLENQSSQDWKLIQISSGESCTSCRAKQTLFAQELEDRGLIQPRNYFVIFKATYEQTNKTAGFNDSPYDQTFRAINALGLLQKPYGLLQIKNDFSKNPIIAEMIQRREIVYNPCELVKSFSYSENLQNFFQENKDTPFAAVISDDDVILSKAIDQREKDTANINLPENSAITNALQKAADLLKEQGKFEAWDLNGARLVTNISEIGPLSYSESLWFNISKIEIIEDYINDNINDLAQELPGISNNDLFQKVAVDYNDPHSPLCVIYGGSMEEDSISQLIWKAKIAQEQLQMRQASRLESIKNLGIGHFNFIGGQSSHVKDIVEYSTINSNYNGKQADPEIG